MTFDWDVAICSRLVLVAHRSTFWLLSALPGSGPLLLKTQVLQPHGIENNNMYCFSEHFLSTFYVLGTVLHVHYLFCRWQHSSKVGTVITIPIFRAGKLRLSEGEGIDSKGVKKERAARRETPLLQRLGGEPADGAQI